MPLPGSKKTTSSRATQTPQQINEQQEKDRLAALKNGDSPEVTNAKANQDIADTENTAVLAEATDIGTELASHPEFELALEQAVDFKKQDNYKSIRMLTLLERFLSDDKLARLPWPGSEKKDAELDALKLPPDKRPNILIYDKMKGAGRGAQSYYRSLVLATHAGKKANDERNKLKAIPDTQQTSTTETDSEDETLAINQMLSAIRTAAKVRIQLNKLKKIKNIEFQWIREDEEQPLPAKCDATMAYIDDASPVKKTVKCMWFKNTSSKTKPPIRRSVGQFLRWKISDEMMDGRNVSLEYLEESPNKTLERDPVTGKTKLVTPVSTARNNQPPAATGGEITVKKAKRYEATNITEAFEALSGFVGYHDTHEITERTARHKSVLDNIKHSDEAKATAYAVWSILEPVFASDPVLRQQAQEWLKKTG